jgi:hypothetical protein
LGTQWHWYCPWIAVPPTLLFNNVDGSGNGIKIWKVTYAGGYCWLDGAGPWAGGDASYVANINQWNATITETYAGFVEVGSVRDHDANATFVGYGEECMNLSLTNNEKLGDTGDGPLPAGYPNFWYWNPCADIGTVGPGEWGDVDSITFTIFGCAGLATEAKSWGAVKALYKN